MRVIETEPNLFNLYAHLYQVARQKTLRKYFKNDLSDESALLEKVQELPQSEQISLFKDIYEHSRQAGLYIVKQEGDTFSTDKIIAFLNSTDIPCMSGGWNILNIENNTWNRFRNNCPDTVCRSRCNYWRESVRGLIEGLGDTTKFARHRSIGHGDIICVDFIYDSEYSDYRFGFITEEIAALFEPLKDELAKHGLKLILDGFSEGILFYRIIDDKGRSTGQTYQETVQKTVREIMPEIRLVETTDLYNY
jgi:hypothetical protein